MERSVTGAAVVIFAKSTDWMRDFALEYPDEGASARLPAAGRIERVQQRKGLIVEIECLIKDATVLTHACDNGAVVLRIPFAQEIEPMLASLAPESVPAEPARFAVAKRLPGGGAPTALATSPACCRNRFALPACKAARPTTVPQRVPAIMSS